ncbi:hypothetical protein [Gimesia aquarii]|uniref:YHS domain protein n=1 Tax=Gimesia aquarii TaxID=2527964 RepID=A0A517WQE9_9PLAN|nr:hypothetical protein [Gimesia aquarii]QDU07483.1 YHS domain protein [Gimesia aquarii]
MSTKISRRSLFTTFVVTLLMSPAFSQVSEADHTPGHKVGLKGYCPVCVIEARKWERGRREFHSTYDNVTYFFPNLAIKRKFDQNPVKYVPALAGDCTVCYKKLKKRVPGNIDHVAIYKNRLYLFPGESEKKTFLADPFAFIDTDLAANGLCVVCYKKVNKRVLGNTRFTEIHNGFRYLFPSVREQAEFRRAPDFYALAGMKQETQQISFRTNQPGKTLESFAGKSTCAGCEHGVTPIGSPDELGLAINASGGRVIVVEEAHKLYPKIYAARFQGQQLQVKGQVIKSLGKISWLKPTSLKVIN